MRKTLIKYKRQMIQNNASREEILSVEEMREKYDSAYTSYLPDQEILEELKALIRDKQILIVLGTWCSDSRLHVSHFHKIADDAGIPENSISHICVDEMKKAEDGMIDQLDIISVPTFIFMENEREIGRIIEAPVNTLESDIVQILKKI